MIASLRCYGLKRGYQPIDDDRSRLRTAVKTNSATGAAFARIARGMHAVAAQFGGEFQAFRRAGLDAEPASFALFNID